MRRTVIAPDLSCIPEVFHPLLNSPVFDSSCSADAKVYFLDREGGLFLKSAAKGTLQSEAQLNSYFHSKGFGAEVISYLSEESDWLLTRAIPGEDCTHPDYLSDPKKLCDTTATLLRQLHETDAADCPIATRNPFSLSTAEANYRAGKYDASLFPASWGFAAKEEAWQEIQHNGHHLQKNALLHGDYCLPNILLDHWKFSGFIDVGFGGLGDRHIDIFWGAWTLFFNLKTNAYYDRFLDAYGRDVLQTELLRTVAAIESFL